MAIAVFAHYRCGQAHRPGSRTRCGHGGAHPGRARDLDYQVFRDPKDPSLFAGFERYTGQSAFQAHLASPHFGTWLKGQVLPSLEDRIRLDLVLLED